MDTTEQVPRVFALPLRSLTMSERRIMASKFAVNWDAIEVDLADIPRPEDPDDPTQEERIAAAKAFTRAVGPNERFALLYIAVKREIPSASEKQIADAADAGDWVLSFDKATPEEVTADADPLPPPSSSTTSS
jgi:hypothetical protein